MNGTKKIPIERIKAIILTKLLSWVDVVQRYPTYRTAVLIPTGTKTDQSDESFLVCLKQLKYGYPYSIQYNDNRKGNSVIKTYWSLGM